MKSEINKISFQYPAPNGPIAIQVILPEFKHSINRWQGLSNRVMEAFGFNRSKNKVKRSFVEMFKGSYQINLQIPPASIDFLVKETSGQRFNEDMSKLIDDSLEAIKNDWKAKVLLATFMIQGKS